MSRARLIAGVSVLQIATACALRLWGLQAVRRAAARFRGVARRAIGASADDARIVWAIDACGGRVSGTRCLVNALVAEMLLDAPLAIGVKRAPDGAFAFHAWTHRNGHVVYGGPATNGYQPFVGAELARPPAGRHAAARSPRECC